MTPIKEQRYLPKYNYNSLLKYNSTYPRTISIQVSWHLPMNNDSYPSTMTPTQEQWYLPKYNYMVYSSIMTLTKVQWYLPKNDVTYPSTITHAQIQWCLLEYNKPTQAQWYLPNDALHPNKIWHRPKYGSTSSYPYWLVIYPSLLCISNFTQVISNMTLYIGLGQQCRDVCRKLPKKSALQPF